MSLTIRENKFLPYSMHRFFVLHKVSTITILVQSDQQNTVQVMLRVTGARASPSIALYLRSWEPAHCSHLIYSCPVRFAPSSLRFAITYYVDVTAVITLEQSGSWAMGTLVIIIIDVVARRGKIAFVFFFGAGVQYV